MTPLEQQICQGLLDIGILRGDLARLLKNNVVNLFFPHGLGHFLGLDTHDVGGYLPNTPRSTKPGLKYLRANRVLEAGKRRPCHDGLCCLCFSV